MFPRFYHAHHALHPEDIDFWLRLAAEHPGPILELGCGTGRVLIPLRQHGYPVYGLDNDSEMLSVLRSNLPPELRAATPAFQADFKDFRLAARFSLIIMPCNTYSTLAANERLAVLGRVQQHLEAGGAFAVSLPNPALLRDLPAYSEAEVEDSFPHPLDGEPVLVSSGWQRTKGHFIVQWHYDQFLADGSLQRLSVQVKHQLTPARRYRDEMLAAGFNSLRQYGDFDRSAFERDSPYLIMLASRAA
ncbi:MAG: class I SAM-dependent methyltransferase [Anaerolineales bacterium]|nr:class I SAM-dependent methyltransferase [Anaerolineales bacterium]